MEAWPVEEAYVVRPLGSLVVVALLPFATDALARAVLGEADQKARQRALTPIRATQLSVAFLVGATALGPSLSPSPTSVASYLAAVACVCVAIVADGAVSRGADPRQLVAGLAAALFFGALTTLWVGRAGLLAGAGALFVAGWVAFHDPQEREPPTSRPVGWVISVFLAALLALPWTLTRIDPPEAAQAGDATWRLRIDPWDEHAMLANAWTSRRRGELDRADAQAREALRMGLPQGLALELEAEVLAARGDCEAARRRFDRALRARAAEAFGEGAELGVPLVLGGYQLPPTLVSDCGGLDQLPGFDDLTLQ